MTAPESSAPSRCFADIGLCEILGVVYITACLSLCDDTDECTAVGVRASGDDGLVECYRKTGVDLFKCDTYYPFDTWTKK